ncbi:MAG: hypothetical protein VX460_05500, partial [Planctomycetota bacterium]|nr:hypothetical protein [Planctomycetota bacterium]
GPPWRRAPRPGAGAPPTPGTTATLATVTATSGGSTMSALAVRALVWLGTITRLPGGHGPTADVLGAGHDSGGSHGVQKTDTTVSSTTTLALTELTSPSTVSKSVSGSASTRSVSRAASAST